MAKFAKIAILLFIAILSTTAYANIVVRQDYPSVPSPSGLTTSSPTPTPSGEETPVTTPDAATPTPDVPLPSGAVPSGAVPSVPSGAVPSGSVIPGFSSLVGKYSTAGPSGAPSYVAPSPTPKSGAAPATTPSAAHKVEASLISGIIIVGFASLFF